MRCFSIYILRPNKHTNLNSRKNQKCLTDIEISTDLTLSLVLIVICSRYNDVAWTWHWYDWSASNSLLFHVCYQHFIIMWWWCRCQLQNWHMRYVYLSSWRKISVVNSTSIQSLMSEHTPSRYVSILSGLLSSIYTDSIACASYWLCMILTI